MMNTLGIVPRSILFASCTIPACGYVLVSEMVLPGPLGRVHFAPRSSGSILVSSLRHLLCLHLCDYGDD